MLATRGSPALRATRQARLRSRAITSATLAEKWVLASNFDQLTGPSSSKASIIAQVCGPYPIDGDLESLLQILDPRLGLGSVASIDTTDVKSNETHALLRTTDWKASRGQGHLDHALIGLVDVDEADGVERRDRRIWRHQR